MDGRERDLRGAIYQYLLDVGMLHVDDAPSMSLADFKDRYAEFVVAHPELGEQGIEMLGDRSLYAWIANRHTPSKARIEQFAEMLGRAGAAQHLDSAEIKADLLQLRQLAMSATSVGHVRQTGGGPAADWYEMDRGRVIVFKRQRDAYVYLTNRIREEHAIEGDRVVSATLIQYSCTNGFEALTAILSCLAPVESGAKTSTAVTVFVQHPDLAQALGTQRQVGLIRNFVEIRSHDDLPPATRARLSIRAYPTPSTQEAIQVSFEHSPDILVLGPVTAGRAHGRRGNNGQHPPEFPEDYLRISARDRYAILVQQGHPAYPLFKHTFDEVLQDLLDASLPATSTWPRAAMPPAVVGWLRERYLAPQANRSGPDTTILGLWPERDYKRLEVIVRALHDHYYNAELKRYDNPVEGARLGLLLAWIERERAVWEGSRMSPAEFEKALDESVQWFDQAHGVFGTLQDDLGMILCQDRAGTCAHLKHHWAEAERRYKDAQTLADECADSAGALLMGHIKHNQGCLFLDRDDDRNLGKARTYLIDALRAFDTREDLSSTWHAVAAFARLARREGRPTAALRLAGALERAGEGVFTPPLGGVLMPTYGVPLREAIAHVSRDLDDEKGKREVDEGRKWTLQEAVAFIEATWASAVHPAQSPGIVRPVPLGARLRAGRDVIAVAALDQHHSPFWREMAQALDVLAVDNGLKVAEYFRRDADIPALLDQLRHLEKRDDLAALVLTPSPIPFPVGSVHNHNDRKRAEEMAQLLEALKQKKVGIVAVDRVLRGPMEGIAASILPDFAASARAATQALVAQGHDQVACLADIEGIDPQDERVEGYRAAIRDVTAKRPGSQLEEIVAWGRMNTLRDERDAHDFHQLRREARRLLDRGVRAFYTTTGYAATHLLDAVREFDATARRDAAGVRPALSIAVVAGDDTMDMERADVATVPYSGPLLAQEAMEYLLGRREDPDPETNPLLRLDLRLGDIKRGKSLVHPSASRGRE